jgi:hypothetical protein
MERAIVRVSDRPDLAPVVAGWLISAFDHPGGRTSDPLTVYILSPANGP